MMFKIMPTENDHRYNIVCDNGRKAELLFNEMIDMSKTSIEYIRSLKHLKESIVSSLADDSCKSIYYGI